jgi:glycine hydroxymethyltransferase
MVDPVAQQDPEIYASMQAELQRQRQNLELIASENYASPAVLAAGGSVLTNKYAEGMPGRRYYGGCEHVDVVERLGAQRACDLFGAEYANLQPHSGSQANMAVFFAFLEPGDTLLAMDLDAGGHLTHGSPVNFSGRLYKAIHYGLRDSDELLDYDQVERLAHLHRPKLIVAGASAYSRQIDFARFGAIARACGAYLLVDMAHLAGLVAAKEHPSPLPHADFVTTTTHKTLRGPRGGLLMAKKAYAKQLNSAVFPRMQGGPLMHLVAGKAIALREAMQPDFVGYQQQIRRNARALGEGLASLGYRLVSGGTDNHLVLLDLQRQKLTGKLAEAALDRAGITTNKNKVPKDPQSPFVTSGLRLGTPALTTRGMAEPQMQQVAELIHRVLQGPQDEANLAAVLAAVRRLTDRFPLYPHLAAAEPGH